MQAHARLPGHGSGSRYATSLGPGTPSRVAPRGLLRAFFPPAASPPDVLSPLPSRLCSYVVGWCVPASKGPRHRRPGLVLTRTPELGLL